MTPYSQKYRTDWNYNNIKLPLVQQFLRWTTEPLAPVFMQFSTLIIITPIRAVLLRTWRHLLQFSTKNWNKENKCTEIKVQKTCALYFIINWNLARYPGKTYCVRKCKKWISKIWSLGHFKNQNKENAFGASMAMFLLTNKIKYKHADYLINIYHWKTSLNESNAGHLRSFVWLLNVSSQLYTFSRAQYLEPLSPT